MPSLDVPPRAENRPAKPAKGTIMQNRIVFIAPERLHAIIETETRAGRRAELAEAILRLLYLQAAYCQAPADHERVATNLPCISAPGRSRPQQEFAWCIVQDPRPNGYGGEFGDHVLNGGLIQYSDDHKWGIHT